MKHYIATVECISKLGNIFKGNAFFEAAQLNKFVLDEVKKRHCESATKRSGQYCDPEHACITFVTLMDGQ